MGGMVQWQPGLPHCGVAAALHGAALLIALRQSTLERLHLVAGAVSGVDTKQRK